MADGTETSENADPAVALYQEANRLNVRLSSRYDASVAQQAKDVAARLFDAVRSQVADFDDFARRIARSEELALHDSAAIDTKQRTARSYYLRAASLLETVEDAAGRAQKIRDS